MWPPSISFQTWSGIIRRGLIACWLQPGVSNLRKKYPSQAMSFDRFIVQSVIASEPKRSKLLAELQSKGDEIAALARQVNENSWKKVEEERSHAEQLGNRATLFITIT